MVPFFKQNKEELFDKQFMLDVAESVSCRIYQQFDIVVAHGSQMDECIIPLQGLFGEYRDQDDISQIEEISKNINMINMQVESDEQRKFNQNSLMGFVEIYFQKREQIDYP